MNDATQFFDTTAAGGYAIERSLRFNSSDSAFLSRTPASAGNRKTWTWAGWVKRCKFGTDTWVLRANSTGSDFLLLGFGSANQFYLTYTAGVSGAGENYTSAVFRDPSAWYHLVCAFDSTQASAANRIKLYVNGVQQTLAVSNPPTLNADYQVNSTSEHRIGGFSGSYADFYLADIHFIDGQALTPSSFTEVDATTGQLIPKAYTGSFGTNGFWLKFSDNSAATATTLGKDYSGNSNNWTPNNLSVEATSQLTPYLSGGTIYNDPFNPNWTWAANQQGYTQGSVNSVQVDFPVGKRPVVNSSVVVVYGSYNNAATTVQCTITYTDATTSVGTNVSATNKWLEAETFTVASTKTISQIKIEWISGDASKWPNLGPITVDGVRLVNSGAGNDSLTDTPTSYGTDTGAGGEVRGNYCTLNPLDKGSTVTLANGNLDASVTSPHNIAAGTVMVSSGKYYAEFVYSALEGGTSGLVGVCNPLASRTSYLGGTTGGVGYNPAGSKWVDGVNTGSLTTSAVGDVIGIALDKDNNQVSFYKNNALIFTQTGLNSAQPYTFAMGHNNSAGSFNFGQRPFAYTAPSGYKALCDTNLPAGTITTSGSFTGNANADGPFIWLNGVPTVMTINGNSVTFGTHADKLANGFKLRTNSTSYNLSGTNNFSATTTGDKFKFARAQANP